MKHITAWISKYALTTGIYSIKAGECGDEMIQDLTTSVPCYFHGKDWHRTQEEAVKKAEEMRTRKIAAVKKQLKKLEEMKF